MSKVFAEFAISLDGFIADPQNGVGQLFKWLMGGDTPLPVHGRVFMTSPASAARYQELLTTTGSHITGRGDYNASNAWGGHNPMNVPVFIVTHNVPEEWVGKDAPFTFVTDGIESALAQARNAAGDKNILIGGSKILQQCLAAKLIDEIRIDLVPVLLGEGIRLFDQLGSEPIELEQTQVIAAPGVTHLTFRVIK